jgi:hypothetical protein
MTVVNAVEGQSKKTSSGSQTHDSKLQALAFSLSYAGKKQRKDMAFSSYHLTGGVHTAYCRNSRLQLRISGTQAFLGR